VGLYIYGDSNAANSPNCYAIWAGDDCCFISGKLHNFNANKPEWNGQGDVIGCGILMSPANKVSIFFTLNGILLGLSHSVSLGNSRILQHKC
jgi:hypothetical protein